MDLNVKNVDRKHQKDVQDANKFGIVAKIVK